MFVASTVCVKGSLQTFLVDDVLEQHILPDVVQDAPITVAPTIDALLHITDNQTHASSVDTFLDEGNEILPL